MTQEYYQQGFPILFKINDVIPVEPLNNLALHLLHTTFIGNEGRIIKEKPKKSRKS